MNGLWHGLGIEHPIVLGAFGGLSSTELTATVSELGGLGSYGLYGYSADRISAVTAHLHTITARPVALNLWLPSGLEGVAETTTAEQFARYADTMRPLYDELSIDVPASPPAMLLPSFSEQFDAVLEALPAVVSFVYGVPSPETVQSAHDAGIVVMGTATTVDEAMALDAGGVDVIVASGFEAAGHRVSFLEPAEDSLVGTFALVPQVVDAVTVPVIAAGGIADRRGVAAALALGASGVQVGTAFLRTRQSAASPAHRELIAATAAHGTRLTRAMSGRLARGIPNLAVRTIEANATIAPFPLQNWLTGQFRAEAGRRGIGQLQSLWAGQAGALAQLTEADAVFTELVAGLTP